MSETRGVKSLIGRGGFTASVAPDGRGVEKSLGYWQWTGSTNERINNLFGGFRQLAGLAQKYHERNRLVAEAKPGTVIDRGDARERLRQARLDQEAVNRVRKSVTEALTAGDHARENLLMELVKKDHPLGKELRDHVRNAKAEERGRLLQDPNYRMAARFAPAALSGMSPAEYGLMLDSELRATYPHVNELDVEREAIEFMQGVVRSAEFAVKAELDSIGEPVQVPPEPKPSKPWVA